MVFNVGNTVAQKKKKTRSEEEEASGCSLCAYKSFYLAAFFYIYRLYMELLLFYL